MAQKRILLSIHPHHAKNILGGRKTVELRRTKLPIRSGDIVIVYASAPTMATVGEFTVKHILQAPPSPLWEKVKRGAGISRAKYRSYFEGSTTAYGIVVAKTKTYRQPVDLQNIRENWHGFVPPQTFRYISAEEQLFVTP